MCRHGKDGLAYAEQWQQLYEASGIPASCFPWPGCMCEAPGSYARSRVEDLKYACADPWEARKKPLNISPAKSGESDDSSGRWYMITFTQPDTIKDPHDILKRSQKVVRSKQVSALQWCYSLELTEKGTPHTHILVYTTKYFDFKKIGNFNAGYRYDIKQEKFNVRNYVVKQASKPTAEWLESYGLDRFFWKSDNCVVDLPEVSPDLISHA